MNIRARRLAAALNLDPARLAYLRGRRRHPYDYDGWFETDDSGSPVRWLGNSVEDAIERNPEVSRG